MALPIFAPHLQRVEAATKAEKTIKIRVVSSFAATRLCRIIISFVAEIGRVHLLALVLALAFRRRFVVFFCELQITSMIKVSTTSSAC